MESEKWETDTKENKKNEKQKQKQEKQTYTHTNTNRNCNSLFTGWEKQLGLNSSFKRIKNQAVKKRQASNILIKINK